MNGKFALALILTLQVTLNLCDAKEPSQELVDKYDGLKSVFYRRILNSINRAQEALGPMVQASDEQRQAAREYVEAVQTNPKFQDAVKIATGLAGEAAPLVERARTAGLGAYEEYMRPHIGSYLEEFINNAKFILDKVMPAE